MNIETQNALIDWTIAVTGALAALDTDCAQRVEINKVFERQRKLLALMQRDLLVSSDSNGVVVQTHP